MGCATSIISRSDDSARDAKFIDDLASPQTVVLTKQHKKVLAENWEILSSDLSGRGSRIFHQIFGRNPLIKSIFSFGHLDGDELTADPRFKAHALRFMQAMGIVVENIDNYSEALTPLLNDLGRRHTQFKGFKPIYFNEFQDSILQVPPTHRHARSKYVTRTISVQNESVTVQTVQLYMVRDRDIGDSKNVSIETEKQTDRQTNKQTAELSNACDHFLSQCPTMSLINTQFIIIKFSD